MGRYSKTLAGVNEKVMVGTATYTDDTTYAAFLANAAHGEMGVFLDSGAIRTTLLTAGLKFFIAQMRTAANDTTKRLVNKTPILLFDELYRKTQTDYEAPVKAIKTIGYNLTSGDLSWSFTTATSTNPLTYGIAVSETTPGNQPFPVQEGYAIVTSSTTDEYTALAQIVSGLNNSNDFAGYAPDRFVYAEIITNGTITEFAATADPILVNGSKTVNFVAAVTIATGAFVVFRRAVYKVAVGVTAGTVITLDRPYEGASETIDVDTTVDLAGTISYTSGTTALGVRLTAINFETHFKARGLGLLTNDTVTELTAWKLGSGAGQQIAELEKTEGFIFDGVGSVLNTEFKDDYNLPSPVASTSGTYHQIFLDFAPALKPSAALPIYEQKQIQRIHICAPSSGTLESTLGTVFGV